MPSGSNLSGEAVWGLLSSAVCSSTEQGRREVSAEFQSPDEILKRDI